MLEGASNLGGLVIGVGLLGASAFALIYARRRRRRRTRKGMAWSDDSPKPPSTHNLKR